LAPTDLGGNNPNPDLRPHATGHSYGCARQRCPDFEAIRDAVEALRASGIFVVVAAGNNGPMYASLFALIQ
jgi:serine protease AprX